mmetsp:Transcript_12199/g.15931  ORF Transcript_12199/g.15931 Transcript_12199/m.15931 type:complete len:97 (+) Transcript_12199:1378-1668(+)
MPIALRKTTNNPIHPLGFTWKAETGLGQEMTKTLFEVHPGKSNRANITVSNLLQERFFAGKVFSKLDGIQGIHVKSQKGSDDMRFLRQIETCYGFR